MQPRLGPTTSGGPSDAPLVVVSRWLSCRRQRAARSNLGLEEVKPSLMIGRELDRQRNESWPQPRPPTADWPKSAEPKLFSPLPLLFLFSFLFATDPAGSSCKSRRISKHDCDPASPASSSSLGPAPNDPRWPRQTTLPKQRPPSSSSTSSISPSSSSSSHLRRPAHRGARSKLEPLVRLFIFVLLVYELHLASLEWWSGRDQRLGSPLPHAQEEQQQNRLTLALRNRTKGNEKEATDCVSREGESVGLVHQRQPSLNKLINWPWPRPPTPPLVQRYNWRRPPPAVLRSMVVSLFAFPLCRANELVGQLSGDKDKESAKLPFAIESDSPSAFPSSLPSVGGEGGGGVEETRGTPTMKTTLAVEANGTNTNTTSTSTYEGTGLAQAEIPINLVAEGRPTAVAGVAETEAESSSYSPSGPSGPRSAKHGQQQQHGQPPAAGVGGGGQNNSNNNNNNETANRSPQPGKVVVFATAAATTNTGGEDPVSSSPSPSSLPSSSSSAASSLADAESTNLLQLQTTAPKTGSHAQAFDPNSAIAKTETDTGTATETVDARNGPSKTRQGRPTKEAANLTMTMERLGLAKKMRQRQQQKQQQQQQQHLTMTSKPTTTRMGKDSSLARSLVALEEKSAVAMSSVICNSRCQCVQLEFVTDDDGDDGELASGETDEGPPDRSGSKGSSRANCKSQPGATTITRPTNATTTTITTDPAPVPLSSSAASQSNVNETDDDAIALAQNQTQCDASGGSDESSGNRIALIEFSQDYSFDDELEAPSDFEGASGWPEDELAEGGAKSEQTTTATTIPTRTTTTPQPGNGPQNQQPAPASRTSGQAGDQQQQQQQQAATSSATASSSLSSSLSSWLGTDRRPSAAVGPSGPGVAAKATTTTATTIKQTGDDQSKDVNVSSATGPASGGRRASRLMLSIKDNKTGTGATNGASTSGSSSSSQTTSSQGSSLASIDGDEESQVRVTPSSSSTATRTTTTAPLGAERHSTDKDSGLSTQLSPAAGVGQPPKRNSQQQPTQPEPASAENFYPFLGDHHHLHQRHHLADHQMGPSVAGLPSASYMLESQVDLAARRQRKGNAIAAAAAAAEHHHHHQDGRSLIDSRPDELGGRRPIKRIVPLRSRSLIVKGAGDGHTTQREGAPERGGGAEVEDMVRLLEDIKGNQIQSVSLRSSKLKFELWTEIYALLAIDMRQNLYHLDLAHNDLVKLGVTFTGYIEHHLAYQLLVHNNQSWPFPNQHQQQTTPHQQTPSLSANTTQQQQQIGNNNYLNLIQLQQTQQSLSSPQSTSTSSTTTTTATSASTISLGLGAAPSGLGAQGASNARRAQLRHPNLGDGRLFNAVRSRLPVDISSLIIHLNKGHTSYTTTTTTGNSHINQTTTTPSQTNTNTINTNAHSSLANHPMLLRSRLQQSPTVLHQPSRIRALDLSHNKLRWLINDQFRILKHVESIRLDHNQIRFIHQLAFNGLESLKYLNLNYNKIQTIYMEQFQTNYNLMALFMRSNYLSFLRAGSFASLNQLKRLDLSKNRFTFLSNNAFVGLDSLKLLNLSSNQFVHVPSTSFHSLAVKLKTLDLSRNLLAQLMPGTFFHLKLERLLLDHNDQLVAIDRGAFWDLPYLKYLSLSSSQVLININSQAFVGVPNLETINYEDCQLLDADTKQMLDNITTSTTLRQLKQQQQQLGTPNGAAAIAADNDSDKDDRFAPIGSNLPSGVIGPMKLTAISAVAKQLGRTGLMVSGGGGGVGAGNELDIGGAGPSKTRWLMKYVYSAACVMFVVIALKLVFKYTSTRHYLNMRRRRRRVYQSSSSSSSASSGSSPASDQHGSSVGDSLGSEDNGSEASLEFASVSESLDNKQNDSPVSLDGGVGDSFMMRELQPHNVIVGPSVSCDTSQHQVDISIVPESSVPSSSPEDNSSVIAVDNGCQNDSSELQQGGEFQLEHHEPFMGCFDCCNQQCGNETDPTNPSSSSSLHVPDDDGTLRGHDLAFEMINGQQLLDQSQICDNLASTNLESAQLELGEHRRESTILDDHHLTHQMTASHANGPGQSLQSVVPDESDNGNCEQNQQQQHLATITSTSEHLEQMHQSPDDNNNNNNNNNGPPPPGPLYGSFRTHTGQTSQQQQWTDQTDCRLFHCACLRCGGPPELVGVNGYI